MPSAPVVDQELRLDHPLGQGHLVSLRLILQEIILEPPAPGFSSMAASLAHVISVTDARSVIYKAFVTSI